MQFARRIHYARWMILCLQAAHCPVAHPERARVPPESAEIEVASVAKADSPEQLGRPRLRALPHPQTIAKAIPALLARPFVDVRAHHVVRAGVFSLSHLSRHQLRRHPLPLSTSRRRNPRSRRPQSHPALTEFPALRNRPQRPRRPREQDSPNHHRQNARSYPSSPHAPQTQAPRLASRPAQATARPSGSMLLRPSSSSRPVENVLLQLCTISRLHPIVRLFLPLRRFPRPPWRRVCAGRAHAVWSARRRCFSPSVSAPEFVANRPCRAL